VITLTGRQTAALYLEDVSGNWHKSKPFISVNVKYLHTLVISTDAAGNLNFGVYNDDRFKYAHPCDN
jgi:hypothetical protein